MVTQDEFKRYTTNLVKLCVIRNNHHALRNGSSACRMELLLVFYLNQAYTARSL
jgi:hypothetical protein